MTDKDVELVEIKDGRYFDIKMPFIIDPRVETEPIFEGDSLRKIVLRRIPREGYFVSTLKKVVHHTMPRIEGKDRGHLIADNFLDYLLTQYEIKTNQTDVYNFFGKGNYINVRPQSPESNRNSTDIAGQLRFEQIIIDFLKVSDQGEVYYEIEETTIKEIFGRRIFIRFLNTDRDDIHVFIPEDR